MKLKPFLIRRPMLALTILVMVVSIGYVWAMPERAAPQFKAYWVSRLRACKSLQDAQTLSKQDLPGHCDTRAFADGSWVVIAWHSFHDVENSLLFFVGDWDGAVLRDSEGRLLWTDEHFCGYEGFYGEVDVKASSLKEWYKRIEFKVAPL